MMNAFTCGTHSRFARSLIPSQSSCKSALHSLYEASSVISCVQDLIHHTLNRVSRQSELLGTADMVVSKGLLRGCFLRCWGGLGGVWGSFGMIVGAVSLMLWTQFGGGETVLGVVVSCGCVAVWWCVVW